MLLAWALVAGRVSGATGDNLIPVGVARRDLSPTNAVPLMGYASRAQMPASTQVARPIHVRALALGGGTNAAVILTIDNCILPGAITTEIRRRLSERLGIPAEQVALTVTHTHSAPCLTGAAPNIFGREISAAEQSQIDAYTAFFTGQLEQAATAALQDRRPAGLAWGRGSVGFAKNRRTAGGPVDHDLPLLRITAPDGKLRAVWTSYACHCTTLGDLNAVHSDWAGVAADAFERDHPGAVALVSIGAGADANPDPRGKVELAERHGESLAAEASRLVALPLTVLTNPPTCRLRTLELPFLPHFTRAEWERRATNSGIVGFHARRWLARLDRGETPSPTLPYPVQTWNFGSQLGMVFLGGEVVVDYSLRLKRELDAQRIWVNAYANDVPCYIPSRRILQEGGYEAESSLWYYDRPQRFSAAIEDQIIQAVRELLPASFTADPTQAEHPPMKSPDEALLALRPRLGMRVELMAAEPLIESPVAIDFGMDGRLWVAEMRDYPLGLDGQGSPGGRIRVLRASKGDGRYDQSEVVAENLPFPTGLMCWKDGVLVGAAPDVWWFRPGPTPGVPWTGTRILSGFATHNFQARVNGLRWGLDGWVYGSGGLFGGTITVVATGKTVECRNRDFRFRPDTGEFEALAGVSQQGRVRDDYDTWFGNDNGTLLWQFPLPDRYLRNGGGITAPGARRVLPGEGDVGRVYPASRTLERFNDPGQANRLTSACGPEYYRDILLGEAFADAVFVCEPVHNLVRRAQLTRDGISFRTRRADGEEQSEFLASTDNWFRPVEARTGPDGALWIVDFNRFVVEHPRWIAPERLKTLDVRAGATSGRLWRVFPAAQSPRPIRDLSRLTAVQWAGVLESPNGVERDWAQRWLATSALGDVEVSAAVAAVATSSSRPASRAQALATLALRGELSAAVLPRGLQDPDSRVQRVALVLTEGRPDAAERLAEWKPSDDPATLFQAWLSWSTVSAAAVGTGGRGLERVAPALQDPWLRTAWLLAARQDPARALLALEQAGARTKPEQGELVVALLEVLARNGREEELRAVLRRWVPTDSHPLAPAELASLLRLYGLLLGQPSALTALATDPDGARAWRRLEKEIFPAAWDQAVGPAASEVSAESWPALVAALGVRADTSAADRQRLLGLLDRDLTSEQREPVLQALRTVSEEALAGELMAGWAARTPNRRGERIALLLTREAWTEALLDQVRNGTVKSAEVSPAQRQKLRQHARPEIREQAEAVFPATASDRAAVVAQFQAVESLTGDAPRGSAEFSRLCASCHRWRGIGQSVGPDLALYRGKPVADYLTAILDPNAALEPRYLAWTAELPGGQVFTGVVQDESSAGLTLVEPGGVCHALKRSQLTRLEPALHSLMPEGLEAGLTAGQMADLLAWLRSSPAPFGQAAAEQVQNARQRFEADPGSRVEQVVTSAESLPYPGALGVLPLRVCRATDGQGRVTWRARGDGGRYRWPVAMGLKSQPEGTFSLWINGREALQFEVELDDAEWARPDGAVSVHYRVVENNSEDSNGTLEVEVAPTWATPGEVATFEVRGSARGSQRWFGLYELPKGKR